MTDGGYDGLLELAYDARAARARVGCLSAGPRFAAAGEWFVLIEDASGQPLHLHHLDLVEIVGDPPVAAVAGALQRAGYESVPLPPFRLWAAEWQLITEADRRPGAGPA